jgi:hypothetical protein
MEPQPSKPKIFAIYTGIGGSYHNGNGRENRWITIELFRKRYNFTLWTWKVGNGDDENRSM